MKTRRLAQTSLSHRAAVLTGAVLLLATQPVLAEVKVSGTQEAVRVSASEATTEEIFAALSKQFDFRYRFSASIGKRFTGEFRGSLRRVLTSFLEGSDYVLSHSKSGGLTIITFATDVSFSPGVPSHPPGRVPVLPLPDQQIGEGGMLATKPPENPREKGGPRRRTLNPEAPGG